MSQERVQDLARRLYERRGKAIVVPYVERSIENWKPEPQWCHWNVDLWVAGEAGSKAVRGWLLFDYVASSGGLLRFVVFQAHSVVEENGTLVDITPSAASRRYPFIRHPGSEDDFQELVADVGAARIEFSMPRT